VLILLFAKYYQHWAYAAKSKKKRKLVASSTLKAASVQDLLALWESVLEW